MTDSEIGALLEGIDKNGTTSIMNYLGIIKKCPKETSHETTMMEAFKEFDKEATGLITKEELKRILCETGDKLSAEEANEEGKVKYEDFVKALLE